MNKQCKRFDSSPAHALLLTVITMTKSAVRDGTTSFASSGPIVNPATEKDGLIVELTELREQHHRHIGAVTDTEEADALLFLDGDDGKDGIYNGDFVEIVSDSAAGHGGGAAPVPGTASNPQVATNIVISFVGAGVLGLPDAFRQAGYLLGTATLLSVSALNVYAMLLLPQVKRALLAKRNERCSSYGEVGLCILGPAGEKVVNICLGISQVGFATAYIIFIAANLYSIAKVPRVVTCAACIPGLAMLVQFQDLKYLAPFSLLANVSNFAAMSAVLLQDYESYSIYDPAGHSEGVKAVDWSGLLYVAAVTIYSMEGIGLILSLEASAKNQKGFPWLLRGMLAIISLFMAVFGTAGYLAFGDGTVAPVTLNLVDHFWTATFVKCGLCLGLYLTYPIMMFPIWGILGSVFPHSQNDKSSRAVIRTSIVMVSALVALGVPDFGKFLSLVGSSICTLLAFIFPCYFHLVALKGDLLVWQTLLDYFLMIGGALFGIMGTYNSVVAMLDGELEGNR
jgi:solute carrier family 36 (proton-coupled amino acid transporter)